MTDEVIQVVIPEAIRPAFDAWLESRGAVLFRMPEDAQREDDLPTYGIMPRNGIIPARYTGRHARRPEDDYKVGQIVGHDVNGIAYVWTGNSRQPRLRFEGQWLLKSDFPELWEVFRESLAKIDSTEHNFRLPDYRARVVQDTPPQ